MPLDRSIFEPRGAGTISLMPKEVGRTIFGTDPAGYQSARLGYPDELYSAIRGYAKGVTDQIFEIGAGTGLATRDILGMLAPERLVAVEVDPAMARYLSEALPDPRIELHQCAFEDSQAEGEFDLVCCAAAFHWLDSNTAFARIRSLLRPGGTVALWWNTYRQVGAGDPFADAVAPLVRKVSLAPSENDSGHYSLDTGQHRKAFAEAGLTDFAHQVFSRQRFLSTEGVIELYASYSYVRALDEAARYDLLKDIADIAEHEFGGKVPNVVLTALYMGTSP